ncbi:GFA family protein [uncultured Aliiroseovarius sp.]|uniref:GFA family protein n=1 Tax=Aliiroseovarius subalbicans TaxID=2925840 RepID=UPI00338EF92D
MTDFETRCKCGQTTARFSIKPRARFRCHCTKCQSVYKSSYADALVFRRGQVRIDDSDKIKWVHTKRPSPLIRGLCKTCDAPVLAHFFGALSMVPALSVSGLELPPVNCDIYYRTRTKDIDDDVPKYAGAMATYAGLTMPFLGVLLATGRSVR